VSGIPKNYFVRAAGLGADPDSVGEVGPLVGVVAAVEAGSVAGPVLPLVDADYFRLVEVAEGEVVEAALLVVEVVLLGGVLHTAEVGVGEDLEGVLVVGEEHWGVPRAEEGVAQVDRLDMLVALRMEGVAGSRAALDAVELEGEVEAAGIAGTPGVDDSVVLHMDCMLGNIVDWEDLHV
jgi:hypothetical protein